MEVFILNVSLNRYHEHNKYYLFDTGSSSWLAWTSCNRTTTDRRTSSSRQTTANRSCCVMHAGDDWSDIFKLTPSSSQQHTHSSAVGITGHCPQLHQFLFSVLSVSALSGSFVFSSASLRCHGFVTEKRFTFLGSKLYGFAMRNRTVWA